MTREGKFLLIPVVLVAMTILVGCQTGMMAINNAVAVNTAPAPTATSAPATPADDAPRISIADAKAAFDAGNAFFVDSRAESAYKAEHIKGAINIPGGTLEAKLKDLPKDKKIIVYCS